MSNFNKNKSMREIVEPNMMLLEDVASEEKLIACIIKYESCLIDAITKINKDYFTQEHTKLIFTTIKNLISKNIVIDVEMIGMNISNSIKNSAIYNKVGGNLLLQNLVDNSLEKHYEPLLDKVISAYLRRQVWYSAKEVAKIVTTDDTLNKDGIVSLVEKISSSVTETSYDTGESYKLGDDLDNKLEQRKKFRGMLQGWSTGLPTLDNIIQGLRPGKLIIISASSKIGKSLMIANFAKSVAIDQERPVLIISTEMSATEDEDRILAITSGVSEELIRNGLYTVNDEYVKAVEEAKEKIKNSYILHEWRPIFTIEEIESLCKKYYIKYGVYCIFFDYIKCSMVRNMSQVSEWQFLGFLTYALKNIATKLQIPVVATAQLNRQAVGESNIEQDRIGGSLRIIQTANTILALRGLTKKEKEQLSDKRVNLILEVMANRDGRSNVSIKLNKHEDNGRIVEVD